MDERVSQDRATASLKRQAPLTKYLKRKGFFKGISKNQEKAAYEFIRDMVYELDSIAEMQIISRRHHIPKLTGLMDRLFLGGRIERYIFEKQDSSQNSDRLRRLLQLLEVFEHEKEKEYASKERLVNNGVNNGVFLVEQEALRRPPHIRVKEVLTLDFH